MKNLLRRTIICISQLILLYVPVKAEQLWLQPDFGIIYQISYVNKQPVVTKVYNVSHNSKYCVVDTLNSLSQRRQFMHGKVTVNNQKLIQFKRFPASFPLYYHKISTLPTSCRQAHQTQDPLVNFEILWQYFHDYYPTFDERLGGLSQWIALKQQYLPQLSQHTNENELLQLMQSMLMRLHDGHVNLYFKGDFDKGIDTDAPDPKRPDKDIFIKSFLHSYGLTQTSNDAYRQFGLALNQQLKTIDNQYLQKVYYGPEMSTEFPGFPSHPVYAWGLLSKDNSVAYLRILQELHFGENSIDSTDEDYQSAQYTIDKIVQFLQYKRVNTLVIDLRYNQGGEQAANNLLLRRLLDKKKTLYYVQPYHNGIPEKDMQKYTLSPYMTLSRSSQNLAIKVLLSSFTSSAGEHLTLGLMSIPGTRTYGYTTDGIFASTHTRMLPNGWIFQMPFLKFFAFDKRFYGVTGIVPEIAFSPDNNYLMKQYIDAGKDIILDRVLSDRSAPISATIHKDDIIK